MGNLEIENLFILEHLMDGERDNLLQNTTKVLYSKGEKIIKAGEFVSHLVFIVNGYIKIHSEVKGKEILMNILGPGRMIGCSTMLSFDKHHFSISALEDSVVFHISINTIRELIENNGKFARQIIDYINFNNLEYVNHNLLSLTQNNIRGRLANSLIYLSEKVFKNRTFDIMLSRKELALFSKVSRENVIKTLYEFDSEGWIKLNGKHIEIIKLDQLKKLAQYS
jgi:CRP/FNR family transcriptional regulator